MTIGRVPFMKKSDIDMFYWISVSHISTLDIAEKCFISIQMYCQRSQAVKRGQGKKLSIQDSVQNPHLVGVGGFPTSDMPES